ncbi:MAG: GTPase Era [Eubacteriales bacterium]|nr:GTPase Era [Bacillota bacterium]MBV1727169.1 GTPase Era [Desulforudis sp.]MDP3051782.1 GTPase Era [Eubacteriales bacterium]MDQ7789605.1 GTPase Era [Clostridia bacterium]MBU4533791.1 GTPase Era [Bacillota bacterium]
MKDGYRSGFVTIIGRPNVGKSTLLNSLVGQKVAIISDKPQTTRHRIRSVLTTPQAQMVFVDTPGIHKPKHRLGQLMVEAALGAIRDVDLILMVVDADKTSGPGDEFILEKLKGTDIPVILVINKVDRIEKRQLLPLIDSFSKQFGFAEIIPLSARTGENLDRLRTVMVGYLPNGPQYYPEDVVTDQPQDLILAELVREKVLWLTRQEVPHSVAVVIDEVRDGEKGVKVIRVTIFVERDSQKVILIGQGGEMMKQIGQKARVEIEKMLGVKVFLELWVKVKPGWRQNERALRDLGFDYRD